MVITLKMQDKMLDDWLKVMGPIPEPRRDGDLTAAEIAQSWMISKEKVYDLARDGVLEKVKVKDIENNKAVTVYRPVA